MNKPEEIQILPIGENLTEHLLILVRKRPGMYLGRNHISLLPNYIYGFGAGFHVASGKEDFYFDSTHGFLPWYETNYWIEDRPPFWAYYFLSKVGDDQVKALELYFERLEEYYEWYKSLEK